MVCVWLETWQQPTQETGLFGTLLSMLLGPCAVALNRAAAGDSSAALGLALAKGGWDVVRPRILTIMGHLPNPDAMTDLYLTLLVGDLQIRRVTGAIPPLTPDEIQARSDAALGQFLIVCQNRAAKTA